MFGFERMGLHVRRFLPSQSASPTRRHHKAGSYLCCVIERERALALDVVVSALSERIVGADQDLVSQPSDSAGSFKPIS